MDNFNTVTSVCLSADGRWALSGSYDKTPRLWEVSTGQCAAGRSRARHLLGGLRLSECGWPLGALRKPGPDVSFVGGLDGPL